MPTTAFHTDVASTLLGELLWALAVTGLAVLASAQRPLAAMARAAAAAAARTGGGRRRWLLLISIKLVVADAPSSTAHKFGLILLALPDLSWLLLLLALGVLALATAVTIDAQRSVGEVLDGAVGQTMRGGLLAALLAGALWGCSGRSPAPSCSCEATPDNDHHVASAPGRRRSRTYKGMPASRPGSTAGSCGRRCPTWLGPRR